MILSYLNRNVEKNGKNADIKMTGLSEIAGDFLLLGHHIIKTKLTDGHP